MSRSMGSMYLGFVSPLRHHRSPWSERLEKFQGVVYEYLTVWRELDT